MYDPEAMCQMVAGLQTCKTSFTTAPPFDTHGNISLDSGFQQGLQTNALLMANKGMIACAAFTEAMMLTGDVLNARCCLAVLVSWRPYARQPYSRHFSI